jgi:hypothetical protein
VANRRGILVSLAFPWLFRVGVSKANTVSMLTDPQSSTKQWTPPAAIPAVDVLDLAMQPLRSDVSTKAQVALADKVKETDDILALSTQMMRAGDEAYAQHIEGLPELIGRLHWLAWTLEPMTDAGLAYFVLRIAPAERGQLQGALAAADMTAWAAVVGDVLPLLPGKPAQHADLSDAVRTRLEALIVSAGGRMGLTRDIATALERDPAARAFIDAARSALDDQTRVYFLFQSMINHFAEERTVAGQLAALNALPVPHRVVWLVHIYRSELHNGGIEQNFSNSGGVFAPETAAALRVVGLNAHAGVMEQGIALFPKPYPRDRTSTAWPADISDKLYPLGDDLNGDEIDLALAAYVRWEGILPK